MSNSVQIGERLKKYREKLDMTVEALAERTGLPASRITAFEEGKASAAIGIMMKLSRALGQRVGTFMDDQQNADPVITRMAEREEAIATHRASDEGHYRYYALGSGKADRHMEPFFVRISPAEEKNLSSHEGEEFVVVVAGEIELIYGNETHRLQKGDTMYYNSLVPHNLSAVDGDAEVYGIIYST